MAVCSKLHKSTQELIEGSWLPQLDELCKNMVTKELVDKVHDNSNSRRSIVEAITTITTDLIEKHLLHPIKLNTIIQEFMVTLLKDMSTLEDNIAMHNVVLE